MMALWEADIFKNLPDKALRPGGLKVTKMALDWLLNQGFWKAEAQKLLALDLGCGLGASLNLLAQYGFKALGMDLKITPDFSQLELWKIQADLWHPPLKKYQFDLILLECVLSILPDQLKALEIIKSLLKPGGIIIFSDLTLKNPFDNLIFSDQCKANLKLANNSQINSSLKNPSNNAINRLSQEENWANDNLKLPNQVNLGANSSEKTGKSCLDGAKSGLAWRKLFEVSKLKVLYAKDFPKAIAKLLAQMVWYNPEADLASLIDCFKASKKCLLPGLSKYSYGLWILQKER